MTLQWNREQIFKWNFENLLSISVPKQAENMSWIMQTDFHEAILTSATWKFVSSFLSEEYKNWQYPGKASFSWLSKPKLYSDNYYYFPVYTVLQQKCGFINCCGMGMKMLCSKKYSLLS